MSSAAAEDLLAAANARWARHTAALVVRPDVPLHGAGSTWSARDEYAHPARWLAVAGARVRASRDGRRPPDLGGDPNLRWQAEDRALTLTEARQRAAHAHEQLLAAVATLPPGEPGEPGDGLRALAAGDLVAHFDEHFGFIVAGMLTDEAATWAALLAQLDAASIEAPNAGARPASSAGDVFAHLARWFDFAERSLTSFRAGRPMPEIPDLDETNRAWSEADRALDPGEARRAAVDVRARVLVLAGAIPPARWTAAALNRLDGNTIGHYPEHLRTTGV